MKQKLKDIERKKREKKVSRSFNMYYIEKLVDLKKKIFGFMFSSTSLLL